MITQAFIQELGHGRLGREEQLLVKELTRRGVPVTLFMRKLIDRRQLPLTPQTFVAGEVPVMRGALRQLNIEPPPPHDYPLCLRPWLHRHVWRSTLGNVQRLVIEEGRVIFAKPAEQSKKFTGRVFDGASAFGFVGSTSRRQEVWCSDVVEWRSEYRVYVIGTKIVSVDFYWGSAKFPVDMARVEEAVAVWRATGEAPAAYAIDFGVLATGETALIEANDGFSVGAYKIEEGPYTELLVTRWEELMAQTHRSAPPGVETPALE